MTKFGAESFAAFCRADTKRLPLAVMLWQSDVDGVTLECQLTFSSPRNLQSIDEFSNPMFPIEQSTGREFGELCGV